MVRSALENASVNRGTSLNKASEVAPRSCLSGRADFPRMPPKSLSVKGMVNLKEENALPNSGSGSGSLASERISAKDLSIKEAGIYGSELTPLNESKVTAFAVRLDALTSGNELSGNPAEETARLKSRALKGMVRSDEEKAPVNDGKAKGK